jgi:ribonuclease Z
MSLLKKFIACFLGLVVFSSQAQDGTFKVTLLGTGTPVPSITRFGYSTLVEAGDQKMIIDFGRGLTIRLAQLKIPFGRIDAHFLTHFHSDHVNGLPDLWLTGWLRPPYGSRNKPFAIYGPKGVKRLTDGLTQAYGRDLEIRGEDEKNPQQGIAFDANEVTPGVIYQKNGVKVIAFENDHGALVTPSFGYRIEYLGKVVVLSGDTKYSSQVVQQSQAADVLIHCVTVIPEHLLISNPAYKAIYEHLASPEDAARVFNDAKPNLAVYSHIGLNGDATENDLVNRTQKIYKGPLVVGQDLMSINVINGAISR